MIIYNTNWLENLQIRNHANRWFRLQLISVDEKAAIEDAHPVGFYAPSFWISLGLFFFTTVLISAASTLVTLFVIGGMINKQEIISHIALLVFGSACLFMAEKYKRNEHYFHAGTDNALVWAGLGFLVGNFFWLLFEAGIQEEDAFLIAFFGCFLVFTAATIRYSDVISSISALVSWFVFVFFLFGRAGELAKALMPFIVLTNAVGIYFLVKKIAKQETGFYWGNCLSVIESASLIVAYASVNYFVVLEASIAMFDLVLGDGQDIPFATVFYFLTVSVPIAYIYLGLKLKNRAMLRIGLLLVAITIFTIRHYHSILPIETAMTVGGFILLGISYGLIHYLKTPKHGLTYQKEEENNGLLKLEGLVITQTFGTSNKASNDPSFGGGRFGGGGATESF